MHAYVKRMVIVWFDWFLVRKKAKKIDFEIRMNFFCVCLFDSKECTEVIFFRFFLKTFWFPKLSDIQILIIFFFIHSIIMLIIIATRKLISLYRQTGRSIYCWLSKSIINYILMCDTVAAEPKRKKKIKVHKTLRRN